MQNFDVVITNEPEFVRFTTKGNYAFDELFEFLDQVRTETEQAGKVKALIDSRSLRGAMTEAERFAGGKKIAELFGTRIRIALLMPEWNITKLGELAAINRGAQFLVTHSEEEALKFLNS